jgi:hypothetical protein
MRYFFSLVPAYFGNTQYMTKKFTPIRAGDVLQAMLMIQRKRCSAILAIVFTNNQPMYFNYTTEIQSMKV